jgi:hypothetical protein
MPALLRTCLAAALAALVALAAARPHVHEGVASPGHADAPCAVCQLRAAEPAAAPAPDVAPPAVAAVDLATPPGLPPVSGAPLGATPGQSPPPRA